MPYFISTPCIQESDAPHLTLRECGINDDAFLYALYASSRADEMALTRWDATTQLEFLRSQYRARNRHYLDNYKNATQSIALHDRTPVAMQWVARWPGETRLMDLVVADDWRNRGIGTALVQALQHEASARGSRVSVHVWDGNPAAARFYKRLGFSLTSSDQMYSRMDWLPGKTAAHRSNV